MIKSFSELGGEKHKNKQEVIKKQNNIEKNYNKVIGYKKVEEKVINSL